VEANTPPVIGTLGEKTLHAAIKSRLSPDPATHEVRLGPYVADIYTGDRIFEVQTGQFYRLKNKLSTFLAACPVTVVYPIAETKRLYWIDVETGEITGGRLSPKKELPVAILPELYQLGPLAFSKGLSFWVIPAEIEEFRYLNGWSKDGKKGSSRCDRIPLSFGQTVKIETPADCRALLPDLGDPFTQKEFAKAAKLSPRKAWYALQFLQAHDTLLRAGEKGRAFLFTVK
jgi:hypothetical protein